MSDRIKLAEKEEERRIWHSPDIVALCIDSYNGERQEGRIYHQYTDTPLCFASLTAAFLQMDAFYDAICFPFASVRPRSFFIDRKAADAARKSRKMPKLPEYKRKDLVVMEAFEDVIKHRGEDATFIVRVQPACELAGRGYLDRRAEKGEFQKRVGTGQADRRRS